MKIACSSATFARALRAGELTLLEWLDVCANELESDGVVFDRAGLARDDVDYLAQMKKAAADLGLTVAAFDVAEPVSAAFDGAAALTTALALGAPLLLVRAPHATEDPLAWGAFTDALKTLAGDAKRANVTLALRNEPGTLCATPDDLPRVAKDVDSSWLRFALAASVTDNTDVPAGVLAKSVVAVHAIARLGTFAAPGDPTATALIERLARFRGFVVLEDADPDAARDAYHAAIERFAAKRANALWSSAFVS